MLYACSAKGNVFLPIKKTCFLASQKKIWDSGFQDMGVRTSSHLEEEKVLDLEEEDIQCLLLRETDFLPLEGDGILRLLEEEDIPV